MVEHNLAKVGVAGSSPVFRSKIPSWLFRMEFFFATRVAEQVDAQDLKSCFPQRKYGFDSRPGYDLIFCSPDSEKSWGFLIGGYLVLYFSTFLPLNFLLFYRLLFSSGSFSRGRLFKNYLLMGCKNNSRMLF